MTKPTTLQVRTKGDPDLPNGSLVTVTQTTPTHYVGTWGKYSVRVRKDHATKVKQP